MGPKRTRNILTLTQAYDEQLPDEEETQELVIPADLTTLTDAEFSTLREQAVEAFQGIYSPEDVPTADQLAAMRGLRDGIAALNAEGERRRTESDARATEAAELAADLGLQAEEEEEEPAEPEAETTEEQAEAEAEEPEEALVASQNRRLQIPVRRSGRARPQVDPETTAGAETLHNSSGVSTTFEQVAADLNTMLRGYPEAQLNAAAQRGVAINQRHALATVKREFPPELQITNESFSHVEQVMAYATDESRLPGGNLVASGGWCSPSETVYDLYEIESRDGLVSVPEIQIVRGGLRFTPGPDFSTISSGSGFGPYTETQDQGGLYAAGGVSGSKPMYTVPCPSFTDERLEYRGVGVQAGLLQNRAFPELTARTIRGTLVAHDHKVSGDVVSAIAAGSTAVGFAASQVGTTAPILTAVGLQVQHYKATHKMRLAQSLEAIFPMWTKEAIRADLARRSGVDLIDVSDARINAWFAQRGVMAQYVYDWQDLSASSGASATTAFPSSIEFLLYAAGTWVKGMSDIITLDAVYDSTLLGTNDYTALFTEEGYLTAKKGHDSRVVTVPICTSGEVGIGIAIGCNGAPA